MVHVYMKYPVYAREERYYITSHVKTVSVRDVRYREHVLRVTFTRNQTSVLINSLILININAAERFTDAAPHGTYTCTHMHVDNALDQ